MILAVRHPICLPNNTKLSAIAIERRRTINAVTWYGESWNSSTPFDDVVAVDSDVPMPIHAVRTASSKKKNAGRQGAKAVKRIEMEGNINDLLDQKMQPHFGLLALAATFLHKIGLTSVSQPKNSVESLRRLRMPPMSG